jgi:hypothetical protein
MEPFATTLATLVGLLGTYRQERGARKDLDHRDFIEWLEYHRHEELKELITGIYHLQTEVDALLRQDHRQLSLQLSHVEEMVTRLLSHMDGFRTVARRIHPASALSDQAVETLAMFVDSGSDIMIVIRDNDGPRFGLKSTPGVMQMYRPGELRLFDDDLLALCTSGLILEDSNSAGDPIYRLTRAGFSFREVLKENAGDDNSERHGA